MRGRGTDKLIFYCKQKLDLLTSSRVTPIVVFDGSKLMMKSGIEEERERNREAARAKAEAYMREGNKQMAHRKWCEAVDITP